jgi:glycosyltransferase involved in cell wall biosynthesis
MSANETIHVVAFDVPFPPDYGGVTDVYYRCRALKNAGYRIILHCFEYGRGRMHDGSAIADEVHYYDRRKRLKDLFSSLPFIVASRNNPFLLDRLLQDTHPILFEGQHTTFLLDHPALRDRKKLVRLHNVEWQYYKELSARTSSPAKQLFFRLESRKLRKHEAVLKAADVLACISQTDLDYYRESFEQAVYIPVGFDLYPPSVIPVESTPYVLFHGNLSVGENSEAAHWLLNAFDDYTGHHRLVIAGKNPGKELVAACAKRMDVELIANPGREEMNGLIQSAAAHLAIGFQQSGIKLKLLNALMSGKPCIATPQLVAGSGVDRLCTIVSSAEALLQQLATLKPATASAQEQQREEVRGLFSERQLLEVVQERLFWRVLPADERG